MRIVVHPDLRDKTCDMTINWPGSGDLAFWTGLTTYAAMEVEFERGAADRSAAAYSKFVAEKFPSGQAADDARADDGTSEVTWAFIFRLLVRSWAKVLHDGFIDIVSTEDPKPRSRVRSYKGLVNPECRKRATVFEQHEIDVGRTASAIFNRIRMDAAGPRACFNPLGNIYGAFGVFDWAGSAPGGAGLAGVAECFEDQRGFWRWEPSRLLPIICAGSEALFFLRGVGSETRFQMIIYLPRAQLLDHLQVATSRFSAEVSTVV